MLVVCCIFTIYRKEFYYQQYHCLFFGIFFTTTSTETTDKYFATEIGFNKYNTHVLKIQKTIMLSKVGLFPVYKNKQKFLYKHVLIKIENVEELPNLNCENFDEKVFVFVKHVGDTKDGSQPTFFMI